MKQNMVHFLFVLLPVSLVKILIYLYGSMVDGIAALSGSRTFFVEILFLLIVVQGFHVHLDCKGNYLLIT